MAYLDYPSMQESYFFSFLWNCCTVYWQNIVNRSEPMTPSISWMCLQCANGSLIIYGLPANAWWGLIHCLEHHVTMRMICFPSVLNRVHYGKCSSKTWKCNVLHTGCKINWALTRPAMLMNHASWLAEEARKIGTIPVCPFESGRGREWSPIPATTAFCESLRPPA